jgi:hypothetical protein
MDAEQAHEPALLCVLMRLVRREAGYRAWAAWWSDSSAAGGSRDASRCRSSHGSASATCSALRSSSSSPSNSLAAPSRPSLPHPPDHPVRPALSLARLAATSFRHSESKLGGGAAAAAADVPTSTIILTRCARRRLADLACARRRG